MLCTATSCKHHDNIHTQAEEQGDVLRQKAPQASTGMLSARAEP